MQKALKNYPYQAAALRVRLNGTYGKCIYCRLKHGAFFQVIRKATGPATTIRFFLSSLKILIITYNKGCGYADNLVIYGLCA